MARFGRKGVIRRFKVRTQVIYGKRTRIGVIAPGIRRARRKTPRPSTEQINQYKAKI